MPGDVTIDVQESVANPLVVHILQCLRLSLSQGLLQRPSHRAAPGPARCKVDLHSSHPPVLEVETPYSSHPPVVEVGSPGYPRSSHHPVLEAEA